MRRSTTGRKTAKKKVGGVKRKTHRRAHSRSRRLSGTGDIKGMITKLIGLGAGVLAGRVGNNLIIKVAPGFSPLISGLVQMAGGYFIASGSKNPFIDDMADGLMGGGFSVAVVALAHGSPLSSIINGPNDNMTYRYNRVSGGVPRFINGAQLPAVSGAQLPAVAGGIGATPRRQISSNQRKSPVG